MGRPTHMSDENNRLLVAALFVDGRTREEIAKEFDVHKDTVTTWIQRPDVQAQISKLTEERANRVLRKVDKVIEGRLANSEDMDTELLLKIRKEFVPDRNETTIKVDQAGAVEDLLTRITQDPALAAAVAGGAPDEDTDDGSESDTTE